MNRIQHILLVMMLAIIGSLNTWAVDHTPDYYDTEIRNLFKVGRWEDGKKILDAVMDDYGSLSAFNELQGMYYYHFKKYNQARYYLVRSLRDDKANTHSLELIIFVEEETKNYSSAICYINEMLEVNPYSKGWWRKKINLYRKTGNNEEADRLLRRLRQIYPEDRDVNNDAVESQETLLKKARQAGDIDTQIRCLKEILKAQPRNDDYHMRLVNLYIQSGRTSEALEASGNAVAQTRMAKFAKKHAEILAEQGRYMEAMNYVKECQKTYHISCGNLLGDLEIEAARGAQANDPYTMYGRIYERTHSSEALDYLLNTAISRGYYDDALEYLNASLKSGTRDPKTLYRAYLVNHRLGNDKQARKYLERLVEAQPSNADAREDLCLLYYDDAVNNMQLGQYSDAALQLEYVLKNSKDAETLKGANIRLFNCFVEEKHYTLAAEQLEKIKDQQSPLKYSLNRANLLRLQGRNDEALRVLTDAYKQATTENEKLAIATYYEEIAFPQIRNLMERGLTRQAYALARNAVDICPQSVDIMARAISCAAILKEKDDYVNLVAKARSRFPEDPSFIVKEAGIYTLDKDYPKALEIIRPLLDTYVGDSTIVNAYSENSELYALSLRKKKYPYYALAVVDSALVYDAQNRSLLYTKGLIYEDIHMYDSAYVYQKYYIPSLTEVGSFKHHLEEIMAKGAQNRLTFGYQYWRPGSEDTHTSNAQLEYTRKYEKNSYTGTLLYAGRDGSTKSSMTKEEQISGGTGISVGLSWTHRWKPNLSWTLGASYATKYFPQISARIALEWQMKNEWTLDVHASARRIETYTKHYETTREYDYEDVAFGDSVNVTKFTGWDCKKHWLFSLGATLSKTIGQFNIAGSGDVFYMNKNIYWNAGLKMQFFPVEGNTSHFFATGGLGSAPELEIIDSSMPSGFSDLNTYVGMGGLYVLNRHISFSLSGMWYTMYNQSEHLISTYVSDVTVSTTYRNIFFVNAQVILTF